MAHMAFWCNFTNMGWEL